MQTSFGVVSTPSIEAALLSSGGLGVVAVAVQGMGIVGYPMPEGEYGVFDAFNLLVGAGWYDWLLVSCYRRYERNILRRVVATKMDPGGVRGLPVMWEAVGVEVQLEMKYSEQLVGIGNTLVSAVQEHSLGRIDVVDSGAVQGDLLTMDMVRRPGNDTQFMWNWCVKLQSFRRDVMQGLCGLGLEQSGVFVRCVLCGKAVAPLLEDLCRAVRSDRGGGIVVCASCASGGLWPSSVGEG